jgi:hypothetical protein
MSCTYSRRMGRTAQDHVGHRGEVPVQLYLDGESSRTRSINFGVNPSAETVWNKHTWWFIEWCSSPRLCCYSLILS